MARESHRRAGTAGSPQLVLPRGYANAASGWRAIVRTTRARRPAGNARTARLASSSRSNGANTQAPEPVILASGVSFVIAASASATAGCRTHATPDRSFRP